MLRLLEKFKSRFNRNASKDEANRFLMVGIPVMLVVMVVMTGLVRACASAMTGGLV